jgi:hypothetical protein
MNTELFTEALKQHIIFRLNQSKIKITDLVLEELISFALEDSGHEHLYENGSHKKGCDISADENFSVKSAKLKNGKISISSFRLTRYGDDLGSMINFIDNDGKNFDKYLVLSRNEDEDSEVRYRLYILPSDFFKASDLDWKETTNRKNEVSGWNTINNNNNIKLKIVKSMSNQLWIEIKEESIKDNMIFEIKKDIKSLGKDRFVATLSPTNQNIS